VQTWSFFHQISVFSLQQGPKRHPALGFSTQSNPAKENKLYSHHHHHNCASTSEANRLVQSSYAEGRTRLYGTHIMQKRETELA